MMMDVYHEDFRESIAIDDRIKAITAELGLVFSNYDEQENYFVNIAHSAGLNGWELDRLMYNYKDEIIDRLRSKSFGKTSLQEKAYAPMPIIEEEKNNELHEEDICDIKPTLKKTIKYPK